MTELGEYTLRVRIAPSDIDFLNRVFEGYDNLAVVSTEDKGSADPPRDAILLLRGFGKQGSVKRILRGLPFATELLE